MEYGITTGLLLCLPVVQKVHVVLRYQETVTPPGDRLFNQSPRISGKLVNSGLVVKALGIDGIWFATSRRFFHRHLLSWGGY